MSVILPRDIERMAERRAEEMGLSSVADHVARLVTEDARASADPNLEAALLEGLEGEGEEWDPNTMRADCRAALATAKAG